MMEKGRRERINDILRRFGENQLVTGRSPQTVERYGCSLRYFVSFLSDHTDISDITEVTPETIRSFQTYNYYRPKETDPAHRLDIGTQRCFLVALRSFFKYLVDSRLILSDPMSGIEIPRIPRKLPRSIMTQREIQLILSGPDTTTLLGFRDKALLEFLYSTGVRMSEARFLTVYDVSCDKGFVKVACGKGAKPRVVPMGELAAQYVRAYIEKVRPVLGARTQSDILFLSVKGRRLGRSDINRIVRVYAGKAGLKKPITTHSFRHTCATHMLQGRADVRYIQEMLGHKSLDSTQIYTRVLVGDLKKVHQKCHPRERHTRSINKLVYFKPKG